MSIPTKQSLYAIADRYNRTASVTGGAVVFNNIFTPLSNNPIGWDQVQIEFKTVSKYFSLNRSFSVPLEFVHDGAKIIRDRLYRGKGLAEELYLIILSWDSVPGSPTQGTYILEYKGRIDLTKVTDDPLRGVTVSTFEAGALSYLNSNDSVIYEIPCDETNPKAIKVVFDGITLYDKYNYAVINVDIIDNSSLNYTCIPLSFLNNEGDSVGVTHGSPSYEPFDSYDNYIPTSSNNFFSSAYAVNGLQIEGVVSFKWHSQYIQSGRVAIFYRTTKDALGSIPSDKMLFDQQHLIAGVTYNVSVNKTFNLAAGEKLFLIIVLVDNAANNFTISLLPTTISAKFTSINPPSTAWGLRPIDLWQQLISKMTNGRFTGDSNVLRTFNKVVAIAGESIRNIPDEPRFKTSVSDFIQSYNPIPFDPANPKGGLGIKVVNDVIWLEPKADLYNDRTLIVDLGEVAEFKITDIGEYLINTIKTGYPVQDYQNFNTTNGRYEFNDTILWQMPGIDIKKEGNYVSKYRADGYGIEFIRGALAKKDTTDNKGDNEVFLAHISDEKETITTPHNTSRLFTVNTNPTLPAFLAKYNNSIISNSRPTVKGYTKPNTKVGIIIDGGAQDGFTTSDQYGFWSYNITGALSSYAVNGSGTVTSTGIHTISAANTDSGGAVTPGSATTDVSVTINTTLISQFLISSPETGEYLFNNLPVIRGVAPAGSNVSVSIDGTQIGTATADGSCWWEISITTPLTEGAHIVLASWIGNNVSIGFNVAFSNLAYPLVTTVNESTEQVIYNPFPIIRGVAAPNTTFKIYFDYGTTDIQLDALGNVATWGILPPSITSDANGNWSYQVATYQIPEGDHEVSTTPTNQQVFLAIDGYKLYRAAYSSFSGLPAPNPTNVPGAPFNVEISPNMQLLELGPYLHSLAFQQPGEKITFQTADKNKNLSRTLNGKTVTEKADVQISSLADPIFLPYFFEFKTKVPLTFATLMASLGAGDIQFSVNGVVLYALPIGSLTAKPANNEAQTWKLLASPKNSLETLLNLSL